MCCNWLQHLLLPSGCLVCSVVQLPALTMLAAASYVLEVAAALCAQAVIIMVLHDMWVAAVHGYHACVECGCSNGQAGCAADQMSDPCTLLQCWVLQALQGLSYEYTTRHYLTSPRIHATRNGLATAIFGRRVASLQLWHALAL